MFEISTKALVFVWETQLLKTKSHLNVETEHWCPLLTSRCLSWTNFIMSVFSFSLCALYRCLRWCWHLTCCDWIQLDGIVRPIWWILLNSFWPETTLLRFQKGNHRAGFFHFRSDPIYLATLVTNDHKDRFKPKNWCQGRYTFFSPNSLISPWSMFLVLQVSSVKCLVSLSYVNFNVYLHPLSADQRRVGISLRKQLHEQCFCIDRLS